jgi:hypothetical protein
MMAINLIVTKAPEKSYIVITTFTGAGGRIAKNWEARGSALHNRRTVTLAINSGVKIELSELLRIKSLVFVAQNDRESAMIEA